MTRKSEHPLSLRRLLSPTTRLTQEGRARRRYNCGKQTEWNERAETAVALWKSCQQDREGFAQRPLSIADLGAGNERLRPLLARELGVDHEYYPFDLHPQQPTTTRLDVSREMPHREFDLAICLGLLEYLPSIPDFAKSLRGICRFAITSYVTSDSPVAIDRDERIQHGWKTHLTEGEMEAEFATIGFSAIATGRSDGEATNLWIWGSDAP